MTTETQMALLVLTELLTAIRAKDAQRLRDWLGTAIDILGLRVVKICQGVFAAAAERSGV